MSPEGFGRPGITAETPRGSVVVVVALDGVRWQEVFEGVDPTMAKRFRLQSHELVDAPTLVPNLHALMTERGAALGAPGYGEEMVASGPNFVSLPGYLELFRGRWDSLCTDNDCAPTSDRTLADELSARAPGWATEVAVIGSWPGIGKAAARHPERIVVSTGRHGGPTRHYLRRDSLSSALLSAGERAPAFPGHGDYRPDEYTAALALRYLRTEEPRFLFIGLGDTDAFAHRGLYREYLGALKRADALLGQIDADLAEYRRQGRSATLFVTTDHGRGKRFAGHGAIAPESARVWLVAAGSGIRARGLVEAPERRRLADVVPTVRRLLRLPSSQEPSHAAGRPLLELL